MYSSRNICIYTSPDSDSYCVCNGSGKLINRNYSNVFDALSSARVLNSYETGSAIWFGDQTAIRNEYARRVKVTNASVSDIQQLGNAVVDGYAQNAAGALPENLYKDLVQLTDTLVEGMTIAYNRLKESKETAVNQAECELFMDMQRKFCDKIPYYADKAKDLFLEDY